MIAYTIARVKVPTIELLLTALKDIERTARPFNSILVHYRVTPVMTSYSIISTFGWRDTVRTKCIVQEQKDLSLNLDCAARYPMGQRAPCLF